MHILIHASMHTYVRNTYIKICLAMIAKSGWWLTIKGGRGHMRMELGVQICIYDVCFLNLEPFSCFIQDSNYCCLTSIQASQETGKKVWYFHIFKSFPQFIMIHTVKGFGVADEIRVFFFLNSLASSMIQQILAIWSLVPLPFLNSLDIWKFLVHIMLKPSTQDFKHDLISMGDECNCLMDSTFFSTTLLGNWD